jgi:hypothetical protein
MNLETSSGLIFRPPTRYSTFFEEPVSVELASPGAGRTSPFSGTGAGGPDILRSTTSAGENNDGRRRFQTRHALYVRNIECDRNQRLM